MEKIKELRQKFLHSLKACSRSGSGKPVMEFYDDLVNIWGVSASTESLQYGRESSSILSTADNDAFDGEVPDTFGESDFDEAQVQGKDATIATPALQTESGQIRFPN